MTTDPWAAYDEAAKPVESLQPHSLRLAFYGRVSTDDNQDPETSRLWQRSLADPLATREGATIVAEFFDIGVSRSVPWRRRAEANKILDEIASPNRRFDGVVMGEGLRCFMGSQFSDVAPIFEHFEAILLIPEVGGRYDPKNSSHGMLMSVTGGMSTGERQRVQERVRAAQAAQVAVQGKYQGGRPPYGYKAVPYATHPNPKKAADGVQLKRLEVDVEAAPVVRRIFDEALEGVSTREITRRLNTDEVPCPSAHDKQRNTHRAADGWQASTVNAMLRNQRYTGFATYGVFKKQETYIDPENTGLGKTTRLVRNPDPIVRSAQPAHPAIVSVEEWLAVQARVATRSGGRGDKQRVTKGYRLQGLVVCKRCGRRMQASKTNAGTVRYRCRARDIVGSQAAAEHPAEIRVFEAHLASAVIKWVQASFSPEQQSATTDALSQEVERDSVSEMRLANAVTAERAAQSRLNNLQASLEAGVNPAAIADPLNRAYEDLTKARVDAAAAKMVADTKSASEEDVAAMVVEFSEAVDAVLGTDADPAQVNTLFKALGLVIVFDDETNEAVAEIRGENAESPRPERRGGTERVRGGT